MPAARIVETVDIAQDCGMRLFSGKPAAAPDEFSIDRFEEALAMRDLSATSLSEYR